MDKMEGIYRRLTEAGFNTSYAWTGSKRPGSIATAAAIWLKYMDAATTKVVVTVYSNINRGGNSWTTTALDILGTLVGGYDDYTLGPCAYDADTNCLVGDLTLIWKEEPEEDDSGSSGGGSGGSSVTYIPMKMGAVELHHVTKFTASQPSGLSIWEWRLEEFFPGGVGEEVLPAEPFSLTRGKDAYHSCKVTSCQRKWSSGDLIQIKEGTSTGRTTIS